MPGRIARWPLEDDWAERALVDIEGRTGVRPESCPWRALDHPFVAAVVRAHRHYAKGGGLQSVAASYGGSLPACIAWGVEVFDAMLDAVEGHDRREDAEDRARRAESEGHHVGPRSRPLRPRR